MSVNEQVRFGILSFAHYHANFWAEAIAASEDATLVGVWDDDVQRGREAAARHDTRYWRDLVPLLRELDVVGVTSATVHHASLIEEAARAGCHILCEKPMATTMEDCSRIQRAVWNAGVLYLQNFPKRFDPVNRELVEIVRRGDLGKITLVRIRHGHFHGLDEEFAQQWFMDPALSGGGTLIDEGVHATDFLLWLLGEPHCVQATISNSVLDLPVEDTASAVFTYPNGPLAEVSTGWAFLAAEQSIEVYGTGGSAFITGVDLASREFASQPYLRVFRRGGRRGVWEGSDTLPFFVTGDFHRQGPLHIIRCLRSGERPVVGVEEGAKSVQMVLSAYEAADSGRSQVIEFAR